MAAGRLLNALFKHKAFAIRSLSCVPRTVVHKLWTGKLLSGFGRENFPCLSRGLD